MSGCSYSCLVYPESRYVRYVPSAIQMEAAVRALVAGGWLESSTRGWRGVTVEESGSFKKVPLEMTSLTSGVEALTVANTFWIEMHNQRDSGDPTPFEEDPGRSVPSRVLRGRLSLR